MALPDDAHYVPGSGRRLVELANGEVVKRQAAENIRATSLNIPGVSNEYQRRKLFAFGRTAQGRQALDSPKTVRGREATAALRAQNDPRGRDSDTFDGLALAVTRDYVEHGRDFDRSPDGPLAQYLVAIGRRNLGADYSVGETPGT